MKWLRVLLFPFALVYGFVVILRNFLFDSSFFKSSKFNLPVICVGNLNMGGTGKSPHTEYLIRILKDKYRVAVLSRGFGRKDKNFRIADKNANAENLGDEPLQFYKKFGEDITVAVEANRVHGVMDICREKPNTNLVLLDDAFQHRSIHAGLSILLTSFDDPFYSDSILPVGNLREFRQGKKRAQVIVVTKCPSFNSFDPHLIIQKISPLPHQSVFFSRLKYGSFKALNNSDTIENLVGYQLILVTGIANASAFKGSLSENNEIIHHFNYSDHHRFKPSEISEIHSLFDKFASPQTLLVTTEKDAMRLMNENLKTSLEKFPWYYQEIEVEVKDCEKFNNLILDYAEKNS